MELWSSTIRTSYPTYIKVAIVGAGAAASAVLLAKTWRHLYSSAWPLDSAPESDILKAIPSPKVFTLQKLKTATGNFNESNLVSKSKMWCIYKGKLESGATVAVKVLVSGTEICDAEFQREIAVLSFSLHRNVVSLEGVCVENEMLVLVYGCAPAATLESRLLGREGGGSTSLTWYERYKSALEIARALIHLHEGTARIVCHRDVRLLNVLVTEKMVAKLCNFGGAWYHQKEGASSDRNRSLIRVSGGSLSSSGSSGVSSSLGSSDMSSSLGSGSADVEANAMVKEDVLAFGILLLQLVTGRQVEAEVNGKVHHIVNWVADAVERGDDWEAIADRRMGAFDRTQVEILVVLGLHCCQSNTFARPKISEALRILNGDAAIPCIPAHPKNEIVQFPVAFGGRNPTFSLSFHCWLGAEVNEQPRAEKRGKVFKIPYSRNPSFKGRQADLHAIREAFETAGVQAPCVSICGLGGMGKTQLALEYAYRSRELYDGVLWVETSDDMQSNYAALSKVLGLQLSNSTTTEKQIEMVRKELEGTTKYLVILDNVNEEMLDTLRPKVGASHLLLTTRVNLVYVIPLKLDVMSKEEALELLKGNGGPWATQTEILEAIADEIGHLPLALAAAARLLSFNHDPARLLHKIKTDVGQCIEKVPPDLTFRKSSSLSELFDASLDQLSGDNVPDGELTRAIFCVAGFFSPEAIPLPLLTVAAQFFMGREADPEEDGEMAVASLLRLSLAMRDKDGDVIFHRLVQAYARSKCNPKRACSAIVKTLVNSKSLRKAAPHHLHLWETCKGQMERGEWAGNELPLAHLGLIVADYNVVSRNARYRESVAATDAIIARGPSVAGKGYFDAVVSRLTIFARILGNRHKPAESKQLLATALAASENFPEAAIPRIALLAYDKFLNWKQGDREQERDLYALTQLLLTETQRLEDQKEAASCSAWGKYYYKGRNHNIVLAAFEVLGFIFTTRIGDHRTALRLYTVAEHTSVQYCAWGPGSVGALCARLEREARVVRLIALAFMLPCGAPIPSVAAALKRATAGPAFLSEPAREREEKRELLRKNAVRTVEWIADGRGNVRSTLVLAVELGELGLLTGGAEGRDLIRKAAAVLEKELPDIGKTCGADSHELTATLYRLASLHRYLGAPKGLNRAQQILEDRIRTEREHNYVHREFRSHFLLAQVYFEQCLLDSAHAQLARTVDLQLDQSRDSWREERLFELQAAVCWLRGDAAAAASHLDRASASGLVQMGSNAIDLQGIRQRIWQWEESREEDATVAPNGET